MLTVLASLPGVRRIQEQRTVRFVLRGVERTYTFDVIAEWSDGFREAIAIRQTLAALHSDDTLEVIEAICAQRGSAVADDYRSVTYESLDPVAVLNGRLILRCGRDHDHAGQGAVRKALRCLGRATTIREIAEAAGMGPRGARAAVALLQSGLLTNPLGEKLGLDLPLENRLQGIRPQVR